MKQILFLFFFLCIASYAIAAETIAVGPECFEMLKNVNRDHRHIECYFKHMFNMFAQEGRNNQPFSVMLKDFFLTARSNVDRAFPRFHLPPTAYLQVMSDHYGHDFDTIFNSTVQELGPGIMAITTAWRAVEKSFNQKLHEVIIAYKKALAKNDEKRIELEHYMKHLKEIIAQQKKELKKPSFSAV